MQVVLYHFKGKFHVDGKSPIALYILASVTEVTNLYVCSCSMVW